MKTIIINIIKLLSHTFEYISIKLKNLASILGFSEDTRLQILTITTFTSQKSKIFELSNKDNLPNRLAFKALYYTLTNEYEFINFCKNKVIFVIGKTENYEVSCHHNVLINNSTTFEKYWKEIKDNVERLSDPSRKDRKSDDYGTINIFNYFEVRVLNVDEAANTTIKITKNAIKIN